MQVGFFNVGDGACTVVKAPGHKVWVFDAGFRKEPKQALDFKGSSIRSEILIHSIINWIKRDHKGKLGSPKALNLVITHSDIDHYRFMGEISQAFSALKIKKHLFVSFYDVADYFSLADKGLGLENVDKSFTITRVHETDTLPPLKKKKKQDDSTKTKRNTFDWDGEESINGPIWFLGLYTESVSKDKNDNSLIIKVTYKDVSLLITGDATRKTINISEDGTNGLNKKIHFDTEDLKCDILNVPHHGAETNGTSNNFFVEAANASRVVFSSHLDSHDGHPKSRIIQRYLNNMTNVGKKSYHFFCTHHTLTSQEFIDSSLNNFYPFFQFINREDESQLDTCFKTIYVTRNLLYHTGSNGNIFFSWDNSQEITTQCYNYDIKNIEWNLTKKNFTVDPLIEIHDTLASNLLTWLLGSPRSEGYLLEQKIQPFMISIPPDLKSNHLEKLRDGFGSAGSLRSLEILDLGRFKVDGEQFINEIILNCKNLRCLRVGKKSFKDKLHKMTISDKRFFTIPI